MLRTLALGGRDGEVDVWEHTEIVRDCGGVLSHCVGGRKGLLPTPDEFPRFEGGRKPDSWDGSREPGKGGELPVACGTSRQQFKDPGGLGPSCRSTRFSLFQITSLLEAGLPSHPSARSILSQEMRGQGQKRRAESDSF